MSNVTKQKLMLSFISLTLIVAFVGFLMMNQSLAWFSNNKTVSANGLSVSAQGTANLIIGETVEDIKQGNKFSVEFETSKTNMIAVTRDGSPSASAPFLKYLTNHHAVAHNTGLGNGTEELEFAAVPLDPNGSYYIDYTVYIASTEKALNVSSLVATIVSPTSLATELNYLNAASIDFYLDGDYVKTLAVANRETESVDLFEGKNSQDKVIPLNTNGYLTVIMRCYFDGALIDVETGKAYINSFDVETNGINLGVKFSATEIEETQ